MGLPVAALRLADELGRLRPSAPAPCVLPLTADGRSWLLHAPRWWPLAPAELDEMWEAHPDERPVGIIMGRAVQFPRYTQAFGRDYTYTGQVARARPFIDAPRTLQAVLEALHSTPTLAGHNQALANWYATEPGGKPDYMGPHSDDERELIPGAPIVSLSWCSAGHQRRERSCGTRTTIPAAAAGRLPNRAHEPH